MVIFLRKIDCFLVTSNLYVYFLRFCFAQDALGRWFCCNDSYVSDSTLEEVLSEKAYILFFSRTKQRPQTKFDTVVNGSKSHESNGNKTSIMQQTVCQDTRQEANKSTNGTRLLFQKSTCPEKQVNMKVSANHSQTNGSTNYPVPNGTKTFTSQRSDRVETPADINVFSGNNRSDTYSSISSLRSNCSNSSNSMKSKIDQDLPNENRTFSDSGITSKPFAPGNFKISVFKKEVKEENGHTAASLTSIEKGKSGILINEGYATSKKLADNQITKKEL